MLDLGGLIEVDENQVWPRVVATRIDDGGCADGVEKGSREFGAFVNVPVQGKARLVFLDPTPQGLTADVPAIEKHITASIIGRRVDDGHRVCGVLNRKTP